MLSYYYRQAQKAYTTRKYNRNRFRLSTKSYIILYVASILFLLYLHSGTDKTNSEIEASIPIGQHELYKRTLRGPDRMGGGRTKNNQEIIKPNPQAMVLKTEALRRGLISSSEKLKVTLPKTKLKVAILSMSTTKTSYTFLSNQNKWEYAQLHGYDYIMDWKTTVAPKPVVWHKVAMLERANNLTKYDWIWWLDFDTLITNMTIRVEDIIADYAQDPKTDMILNADCFPLNAGSMLFRSTPRLQDYINKLWECSNYNSNEQECLAQQIQDENYLDRGIVNMAPQWRINAFPPEIHCHEEKPHPRPWQPGDFVIHFAGAYAHLPDSEDPTGELFDKYKKSVVYPNHQRGKELVQVKNGGGGGQETPKLKVQWWRGVGSRKGL